MAAALGHDTDSQDLDCCAPKFFVGNCSGLKIHKSEIHQMVKMDCTYSDCTQSGFMHNECLKELEEQMVKYLYSTISNSYKTETFRRYNWNSAKDREHLWKDYGIYGFLYKKLRCNCGRGFVKRDLTWPPATYRRQRRKNNFQSDGHTLPKLKTTNNGPGTKIHYIPAVHPNFPTGDQVSDEKTNLPPGAQYLDKKVVLKRGKIVAWNNVNGKIQNLQSSEERPVVFTVNSVQGNAGELEVGAEVQYTTERRKKKVDVVSVLLVKSVIYQQGVVTHWSPERLAGVIKTNTKEIIVNRKDFLPGGFVGDIVGKIVKFKEDGEEANCVSVVREFQYDTERDLMEVKFSELEVLAVPFLGRLEDLDEEYIEEIVLSKSDEEWGKFVSDIFPFLVKMAAHSKGYRVILLVVENGDYETNEKIVRKISGSFFSLSKTPAGAACILDLVGVVPPGLQSLVLEQYLTVSTSHQAEEHMTGPQSQLVFQASLPLLQVPALRSLTSSLAVGSVLERMTRHPSLGALVSRAARVDTHCLYLLMACLDREDKILEEAFTPLVAKLMQRGGPKCCGIILHKISGRLQSIVTTSQGRNILTLLIQFASDLQLYLVLEEMFVVEEDIPPLFVELASHLDDGGMILKALVPRLDDGTIERIVELFKQQDFRFKIIESNIGKFWLKILSKKLNGGK